VSHAWEEAPPLSHFNVHIEVGRGWAREGLAGPHRGRCTLGGRQLPACQGVVVARERQPLPTCRGAHSLRLQAYKWLHDTGMEPVLPGEIPMPSEAAGLVSTPAPYPRRPSSMHRRRP
jgi:hypothetical protein